MPTRTDTNRRLYSDDDIARLSRLRRAVNAGHSISTVAHLADRELDRITAEDIDGALSAPPEAQRHEEGPPSRLLASCLAALGSLDAAEFEQHLGTARIALPLPVFLEQIIAPLMTEAGRRWQDGQWRIAHEHLASAVVRRILLVYPPTNRLPRNAPPIVVATPAGQNHEIGALMARSVAVAEGWRDIYLGPDTPAAELVHAARVSGARAIALSIVYPPDDPDLAAELDALALHLPPGTQTIVGGKAAHAYIDGMENSGFVCVDSLGDFRQQLSRLRS